MELNVPQWQYAGYLKHSIAGALSMIIGNGIALAVVENFKTGYQVCFYQISLN